MSHDTFQIDSWCDPLGDASVNGLIAQIHFPTAESRLDQQDRNAMEALRQPYTMLMMGRRVHFWCVGHADHRGGEGYNDGLGLSRGRSVGQALDQMFGRMMYYSASPAESRGFLEAQFPMPSREQMGHDRRVDIFCNTIPHRPPYELPLQRILGRRPPDLQIREVPDPNRPPTNWQPATRSTRPVAAENLPGDRTGNSPISLLPQALQYANQATVALRLRQGLEEVRPIVAWMMMDHARGGILIVAAVDVREQGGQRAGSVRYVTDFAGVFAESGHAIGRWRREPRLDAPTAAPPFGHMEYRFFWATRR